MIKHLIEKCDRLDQSLATLLTDLSKHPDEDLAKRPAPNAWSPLEILQHIMIVEKASLQYTRKKTSYPDSLKNAGISRHFRKWLLWFFMALPVKIKAPPVVDERNFDKNATLKSIKNDWENFRAALRAYFENAAQSWENKLTYRHFIAGRLTFDGMLLLFELHFKRHEKQLKRTLDALKL